MRGECDPGRGRQAANARTRAPRAGPAIRDPRRAAFSALPSWSKAANPDAGGMETLDPVPPRLDILDAWDRTQGNKNNHLSPHAVRIAAFPADGPARRLPALLQFAILNALAIAWFAQGGRTPPAILDA